MLNYEFFARNPLLFNSIFGLKLHEFEKLIIKVERVFNKKIIGKYKRPRRFHKLDLRSMVMLLLMYYRHYVTQRFIGALFGLDVANVCRIIRKLEPILSQVMKLPKRTGLQPDELESLIIDATEIRVTMEGKVLHVSESVPGSVHDFALLKRGDEIPKDTRVYVEVGYQGIQDIHKESEYPYKRPKKGELRDEEKEYNTVLSRIRVKVENVLAKIKVFKIMVDRYRNKRERFNEKFRIIAGLVNMKNGFGIA
jgi:hypothetical protein